MLSQNQFIIYMFELSNKNKYAKYYFDIASKIVLRGITKKQAQETHLHIESHHIIPISFNKAYEFSKLNLLHCTPREHFILHLLMTKMFDCDKYINLSKKAIVMFYQTNDKQSRKLTSWEYEHLRKISKELMSGDKHPMYGRVNKNRGKFCFTNGERNIFINPELEEIPNGFYRGSKNKGDVTITNGTVNIRIQAGDILPTGWWIGSKTKGTTSALKGRHLGEYSDERKEKAKSGIHNAGKLKFITNGIIDKKITQNDVLPHGWYYGRTNGVGSFLQKKNCPHCNVDIDVGNFNRHVNHCSTHD